MNWPNSSLFSWSNTWRLDVYVVWESNCGIGYRWNSLRTSFCPMFEELGFSDLHWNYKMLIFTNCYAVTDWTYWHYPGSRYSLMPAESCHFKERICEVTTTLQTHCWHSILCGQQNEKVRSFLDSWPPNCFKTERPGYIQHNSSK